ncbi:MAG: hypothetical protein AB7I59_01430 [Geminicoccaceae bacterium]
MDYVPAMSEIESHTLAWMRRIDAKLDELTAEVAAFRAETRTALDQLRDEQLVTSSICLRLETREVETKGLFGLYHRLKAGQERLESRVAGLERREPI